MPRINDMIESKFFKKEDAEPPVLATIKDITQHDVSMENQPEEMKWCLEFSENFKPLVLNPTNMRILEAMTGSDDTDDWIDKKIVLFNDPNVSFAGKLTGGTRVRAPKGQQPQAQPHPVADEDIPF